MPVPSPAIVQMPAARLEPGDLLLPPMLGAPARVLWRLDGPPMRALTAGSPTVVLSPHELVRMAARPGLEDVVELAERFVHAVAGVMLVQAAVAPSAGVVRALLLSASDLTCLEPAGLWAQTVTVLDRHDRRT